MPNSRYMSEKQTREDLVDRQLRKVGWIKSYVKEEVNSVRSNFQRERVRAVCEPR